MLPEPSGNKQAPRARIASDVYRSRPPPYPRLWFGLRAYDTYRENATCSPCSFLVLRRRGMAGPLLLVPLSPCRSYSRNHSSIPASTASLSIGRGDVVRTARVPLLYPCRYVRKKLSVRESDRRCSPLAFCPRRISVGRAHHYRKRMYSIRRFRTKLTSRRNNRFYPVFPIEAVKEYLHPISFENSLEKKLCNIAFPLSPV